MTHLGDLAPTCTESSATDHDAAQGGRRAALSAQVSRLQLAPRWQHVDGRQLKVRPIHADSPSTARRFGVAQFHIDSPPLIGAGGTKATVLLFACGLAWKVLHMRKMSSIVDDLWAYHLDEPKRLAAGVCVNPGLRCDPDNSWSCFDACRLHMSNSWTPRKSFRGGRHSVRRVQPTTVTDASCQTRMATQSLLCDRQARDEWQRWLRAYKLHSRLVVSTCLVRGEKVFPMPRSEQLAGRQSSKLSISSHLETSGLSCQQTRCRITSVRL